MQSANDDTLNLERRLRRLSLSTTAYMVHNQIVMKQIVAF